MEGQATFSATPQTTSVSDKFISNEIFNFESTELADNDLYSTEFSIVSDSYQGQNPTLKQVPWTFIYNDLESWLDLAGSFIRVQGKVNGNANLPAQVEATTYPDLRSLFEQVKFSLGGKEISSYSKDYHIYAHVSNKFWSKKFRRTVNQLNGGLEDDFAGQPGLERWDAIGFDIGRRPEVDYMAIANSGVGGFPKPIIDFATTRCMNYPLNAFGELCTVENTTTGIRSGVPAVPDFNGTNVTFWIPLVTMLPFLQAYPRVIKGLKVELNIYKSSDKVQLYAPGDLNALRGDNPEEEFQWQNIGCQLYVRRIRANEAIERTLTSRLVEGINYKVNYQDFYYDRHLIESNNIKGEHRIANVGSLPTRIWIAFQDSRAMTDQSMPSDIFTIPNLTDIQCYVNGQLIPQNVIKMDMVGNTTAPPNQVGSENDLTVPYQMYLQACGSAQGNAYMKNFRGGAGCLTYQQWRDTAPIFCWNLDNVAISPYFQGRAEVVIRWVKILKNSQLNPPEPPAGAGYNMFSFVHCLKSAELQFKDHASYITVGSPSAPSPP